MKPIIKVVKEKIEEHRNMQFKDKWQPELQRLKNESEEKEHAVLRQ